MEGQIMNDIGLGIDPISLFEKDCIEETQKQSEDNLFRELSHKWLNHSWKNKYTYHFSWLGRPIIQMPQDILALQEIIWKVKPDLIIETGIAYGWSSYAILLAIRENKFGKLLSIDLPYPFLNEKSNIGILVPEKLRKNWKILFCRDKIGIVKAIKKFNYKIDFFHYDSDKNYNAKLNNLKTIWKYMQPNGIVICDDINDNLAFFDFVKNIKKKYYVIKTGNKFLGIVRNASN